MKFVQLINKDQDNYYKFIVLIMAFLLLAFDFEMAVIYLLLIFGDYIWYSSDNFVSFKLSRKRDSTSNLMVYIEALIALGIFLVISTFLTSMFDPQSMVQGGFVQQAQSIFHLLSTTIPALQNNDYLKFVGWGILIPLIETSFWNGRLLEGFATYAEGVVKHSVSLKKISTVLVTVILFVAALFTLFHITSKRETVPLIITFVFSIVSSLLVIRQQELKGAVFMHIVTNSMAIGSLRGWI
jgi:membrane protease YdiL (CAAX protease family)